MDILEAGFPIASDGDFEAVDAVSREFPWVQVAALARVVHAGCGAGRAVARKCRAAAHPHLHRDQRHSSEVQAEEDRASRCSTRRSRRSSWRGRYVDDVEFSAEDATRTDADYLEQVSRAVVAAGARTVNMPDTVGFSVPDEYGALIGRIAKALGDSRHRQRPLP